MRNAIVAAGICLVAGCGGGFVPVAPQPTGFDKDNPCNVIEPMQRAQAVYPPGSQQPGWVALQYDINAEGATTNVAVVDSSPPGEFDQSAVAAVTQWRYRASETTHTGCKLLITFRPPDL